MVIGLTGGVGCGKSTVIACLEQDFHAKILMADEIGHRAMEPGTSCYDQIVQLFGKCCVTEDGEIDRNAVAARMYASDELREQLNGIIHPYVKNEIRKKLMEWSDEPLIVVETAILFESGCDEICDEVWGVLTSGEIRIQRLMDSRNYSVEKCQAIMKKQLSDDEFERRCKRIIRNDGDMQELRNQLKELLHNYGFLCYNE